MRQLCCHPGLIKGMLDPESVSHEVIEDGGEDIDLISRLEVMNLEKDESGTLSAFRCKAIPEKYIDPQKYICLIPSVADLDPGSGAF
jgi:hypothetical protein